MIFLGRSCDHRCCQGKWAWKNKSNIGRRAKNINENKRRSNIQELVDKSDCLPEQYHCQRAESLAFAETIKSSSHSVTSSNICRASELRSNGKVECPCWLLWLQTEKPKYKQFKRVGFLLEALGK